MTPWLGSGTIHRIKRRKPWNFNLPSWKHRTHIGHDKSHTTVDTQRTMGPGVVCCRVGCNKRPHISMNLAMFGINWYHLLVLVARKSAMTRTNQQPGQFLFPVLISFSFYAGNWGNWNHSSETDFFHEIFPKIQIQHQTSSEKTYWDVQGRCSNINPFAGFCRVTFCSKCWYTNTRYMVKFSKQKSQLVSNTGNRRGKNTAYN